MAGFWSTKLKRKELDEVNDDFSDFSLSSPARKIRRLDAELPPIMEEEEPEVPLVFKHPAAPEEHLPRNLELVTGSGPVIEELPTVDDNEEKAIVLFKHMNTPFWKAPSNFSVTVNSDLILGIKNQILLSSQSNAVTSSEDEAARQDSHAGKPSGSLAVVPWVPSQIPPTTGEEVSQTEVAELMETEELGAAIMDIEEGNDDVAEVGQGYEFSGMTEGFHPWQQQHCMIPQLSQNTATPVVWFR